MAAAAALGTQLDTTADSTLPAILAANESILNTMHGAGLPWWGTIVTSTLLLRTSLTLPIAIYQQRSLGRMLQLAPMVQSWQTTLNSKILHESKEKGWSHKEYNTELQKQVWNSKEITRHFILYSYLVQENSQSHLCRKWMRAMESDAVTVCANPIICIHVVNTTTLERLPFTMVW
jgi:hypothetical protein